MMVEQWRANISSHCKASSWWLVRCALSKNLFWIDELKRMFFTWRLPLVDWWLETTRWTSWRGARRIRQQPPSTWTGSPPHSESASNWVGDPDYLWPGQVLRLTQKVQDKEQVGWRKSLLRPTWSSSDDQQALIASNKQTSWNTIKHNLLLSSQCDRLVFGLKEESIEQTDGCLKYEKNYAFIGFPMMLNWLLRTPNRMF